MKIKAVQKNKIFISEQIEERKTMIKRKQTNKEQNEIL